MRYGSVTAGVQGLAGTFVAAVATGAGEHGTERPHPVVGPLEEIAAHVYQAADQGRQRKSPQVDHLGVTTTQRVATMARSQLHTLAVQDLCSGEITIGLGIPGCPLPVVQRLLELDELFLEGPRQRIQVFATTVTRFGRL
eukprot:CAMPEP_0119000098 /NCGR_PEP_ID=MMETSP1173-20130426/63908_1 /TAXON_ID=1034831 /ORGANISM="Rhizochromulina marina cf, Strain CCMP1243" /LENGTH=139 /DNA_ID=CAMNT_0006951601 /DNA_START=348 /DNA_END=763 /DNA_ORIENTATION=-